MVSGRSPHKYLQLHSAKAKMIVWNAEGRPHPWHRTLRLPADPSLFIVNGEGESHGLSGSCTRQSNKQIFIPVRPSSAASAALYERHMEQRPASSGPKRAGDWMNCDEKPGSCAAHPARGSNPLAHNTNPCGPDTPIFHCQPEGLVLQARSLAPGGLPWLAKERSHADVV